MVPYPTEFPVDAALLLAGAVKGGDYGNPGALLQAAYTLEGYALYRLGPTPAKTLGSPASAVLTRDALGDLLGDYAAGKDHLRSLNVNWSAVLQALLPLIAELLAGRM